MNSICAVLRNATTGFLLCCLWTAQAHADLLPAQGNLDALRQLKIESGSVQSVESLDKPTTAANGRTVPAHTTLKIILNPARGSNINVEIWLPPAEKWNGRLIGAHDYAADFGIDPGVLRAHCSDGFATVVSDLGMGPDGKSGVGNPEVWKDYGYRATHLMTLVAKQAVNAYYGKAPQYSYYVTEFCAGELGFQEAQRYPEDYDGIDIAQPYQSRPLQQAFAIWSKQILDKCAFTVSQRTAFVQAGRDYLVPRQVPALAGKFVPDPRITSKDIDGVIALARQKDSSLTQVQADWLRKLLDGPRREGTGERIYYGVPAGSDISAAGRANTFLLDWVFSGKKSLGQVNTAEDIDVCNTALGPYLDAENADLSAFEKHGGKLTITLWASDPNAPILGTIDYYERVVAHFGGDLAKVRSFFNLYVIPGTAHGPQPVSWGRPRGLEILMNWREKGTAPASVTCRYILNGKVEWEVPFSPYPAQTTWDAKSKSYQMTDGPRGVTEPVAARYRLAPVK